MRLLLAEDERYLSSALCEILSKQKYEVDPVYDGKSALDYIRSGVYDLVILDIMMPKMDGIAVLRTIRREKNSIPVLMLTARDEIQDKVSE
ncbi:MAG: response regulator [Spirochaetaceae bacterium]|nr:response regulator [Spirochaetaceae bacterium]